MKKITIILISFCLYLTAYSQNNNLDLTYLGFPIKGNMTEFADKLCKEKGMTNKSSLGHLDNGEPCISMRGDFWKFKNCLISVIGDNNYNVYNVSTLIEEVTEYRPILADLFDILDEKYGRHKIERKNDDEILVWESEKGLIQALFFTIPGILDALRIEYYNYDMEKYKKERDIERKKEMDDL